MLLSMAPLEPGGPEKPVQGTHTAHYSINTYMKSDGLSDSQPLHVRMLLAVLKHEQVEWGIKLLPLKHF